MLAHARLAEALVELDYVDQAKDELLRVNAADRASLPTLDALYLDAITATARQDSAKAVELYKKIVNEVLTLIRLMCWWIWDVPMRTTTTSRAPLRVIKKPVIETRNMRQPTCTWELCTDKRANSIRRWSLFKQAESIYQALGNLEGRAEVAFQRGYLFNKRNNLSQAKTELVQALSLAKANDNKSQIIKTLLQLCSVAFDEGETARATEYAQRGG